MVRTVLPPTSEQLAHARETVGHYLSPTPTVMVGVRGREVYAKLESLQVTGIFKMRGALAAVDAAHRNDPHGAVMTASAGNHGLGIAYAATLLKVPATVVVPANASGRQGEEALDLRRRAHPVRILLRRRAGARPRSGGATRSTRFISPFNDADVIAGQSTVFEEMLFQAPISSTSSCRWVAAASCREPC